MSLSYETAEKLKEAGFPSNPFRRGSCPCIEATVEKDGMWVCGHKQEDFINIPTLSELIEACGDKLKLLINCGNHWQTQGLYKEHELRGYSPEEAVAALYLAINNK